MHVKRPSIAFDRPAQDCVSTPRSLHVHERLASHSSGYGEACNPHAFARSAQRTHATADHSTHTIYTYTRAARISATPVVVAALHRVINFLPRRPFFDFIALYLPQSCTDADVDHMVVIGVRHSTCPCNSLLDAALLVTVQR
jgi:hypothetical protein